MSDIDAIRQRIDVSQPNRHVQGHRLKEILNKLYDNAMGRKILSLATRNRTLTFQIAFGQDGSYYNKREHLVTLSDHAFSMADGTSAVHTVLHEIVHAALNSHTHFAANRIVLGVSSFLTRRARAMGVSQAQYDRIFAPLRSIENYEQAATDLANSLARSILGFEANGTEYYVPDLNPPPSLNSVNVGALPNRPVTPEEIQAFNSAIQQAIAKTGNTRFNDYGTLSTALEFRGHNTQLT